MERLTLRGNLCWRRRGTEGAAGSAAAYDYEDCLEQLSN